jgi:hypothetical protein
MDQMIFHTGFDQGISQTFLRTAAAGPVFGPSLGSVSPVLDLVQRGGVFRFISRLMEEGLLPRESAMERMN